MNAAASHLATWTIAVAATALVIARPFRWPEAVWAAAGAALLVTLGLLSWRDGLLAVGKGLDVYLFLAGMMLLSETARREGLFDWVAAAAVNHARRSPRRLFLLVYGVRTAVTALLSNDATAVVLTPAVFAAARKAELEPLPYLFACAFVANAASFVLPISNPANLVLYADHVPALGRWLASFALPSLLSIAATYAALRMVQARALKGRCADEVAQPRLDAGGWTALAGIAATAAALLTVSALGLQLGLPTCALGVMTTAAVLARKREAPWATLRGVSWGVLVLVAGLFVMVAAVERTGVAAVIARALGDGTQRSASEAAAVASVILALACNLTNNLPAGLVAAGALAHARPPQVVTDALLIGLDLGPNLSVTGSLATILWLTAIRREGEEVGFWRFLKVGAIVTPPALGLAILARLLLR